MKEKSTNKVKIPCFYSDKEAFEWYESHEITDHLDDTEEIRPDTVIYQGSNGFWYRGSDGIRMPAPKKRNPTKRYGIEESVRDIHEAPQKEVFIIANERREDYGQGTIIEKEDKISWTSTSISSATMPKLHTK